MKRIALNILTLIIILSLAACGRPGEKSSNPSSNSSTNTSSSSTEPAPPGEAPSKAEQLLREMTLEEKIGQLFIIRPESLKSNLTAEQVNNSKAYGATELESQMAEALKRYAVGGVALFQKNILSPAQLTAFVDAMQEQGKIPLFVGVDEEGGPVSRIANSKGFDVQKYESMEAIGRTGDRKTAQNVGFTIGSYLKRYGFNLDFAPVADVNTNPDNIVIGNRSFGSDPALVAGWYPQRLPGSTKRA